MFFANSSPAPFDVCHGLQSHTASYYASLPDVLNGGPWHGLKNFYAGAVRLGATWMGPSGPPQLPILKDADLLQASWSR